MFGCSVSLLVRSRYSCFFLKKFFVWAGEKGMIDEAQKLLEEAEALRKVIFF